MTRLIIVSAALATCAGVLTFAPSVYAQAASIDVPASTFVASRCIWGNSTTPVPTPGILGRSNDNKILSTNGLPNSAAAGVVLTCNNNFQLTITPPIGTTTLATTFKSTATTCQTRIDGGSVSLINNSCTTNASGNFTPTSALMGVNFFVQGPTAAPAGVYGYKLTATATPL